MRGSEYCVHIGTYTRRESFVDGRADGIHVAKFDAASGHLRVEATVAGEGAVNPSFLALARDARTLYAVGEITRGSGPHGLVSAFAVESGGSALRFLGQQSSHGFSPCFISVDATGTHALVANYESGSVCVLPIRKDDGSLGEASDVVQLSGSGPDRERQEGPHAHAIVQSPVDGSILVSDLGADRLWIYRLDSRTGRLAPGAVSSLKLESGSGPRHVAFHPQHPIAYVVGELDSSITLVRLAADPSAPSLGPRVSTLPSDFEGANLAAEIQVDADGRNLYVSNRGHDSIAQLRIDPGSGALTPVRHVSCEGATPRHFSLDPTGRWLLVANQDSDAVVSLPVDATHGELGAPAHAAEVATPVCLRFAPASIAS